MKELENVKYLYMLDNNDIIFKTACGYLYYDNISTRLLEKTERQVECLKENNNVKIFVGNKAKYFAKSVQQKLLYKYATNKMKK